SSSTYNTTFRVSGLTLGGTGKVILDRGQGGVPLLDFSSSDRTLTVGPDQTIEGSGRIGVYSHGMVVNQGVINATTGGIDINSPITNEGTLEAVGPGVLEIDSSNSLDNSAGQIVITGSALINNGTITGGVLDLTGGSTLTGTGDLDSLTVPQ